LSSAAPRGDSAATASVLEKAQVLAAGCLCVIVDEVSVSLAPFHLLFLPLPAIGLLCPSPIGLFLLLAPAARPVFGQHGGARIMLRE